MSKSAVLGVGSTLVLLFGTAACEQENSPVSFGPSTPVRDTTEPWGCLDSSACEESYHAPFSPIFETPEGVELRTAQGDLLLGKVDATKQVVLYQVVVSFDASTVALPHVIEAMRFDASYDRVELGPEGTVLACAGAACDLIRWHSNETLRVPDDISPTVVTEDCVGGRGIRCFHKTERRWFWAATPEQFATPIAVLSGAWPDFLVVDTSGAAFSVRTGVVAPFDTGTTEPLVSLAGTMGDWIGRTASGALFFGSIKRGLVCDATVDAVGFDGSAYSKRGDTLLRHYADSCYRSPLPAGMIGVGAVGSQRYPEAMFVFDTHHVSATTAHMDID